MITRRVVGRLDERLGFSRTGRTALAKIFPDHWSFLLGEIALYSFLLLVGTGVFLTLFFEPSTSERVYTGSYAPLHGEEVSGAYASAVELSWDVQAGLLMRQAHHWAALIFVAAIVLHLCRIFFTAAFRKPREINWLVGVTLLALAIVNGFLGYSLPDDLLSGTGLRIAYSVVLSVPVVGPWAAFLLLAGEFPGEALLPRLYIAHVLLVPGAIAALIGIHLAILVLQKHTHFAGRGRSDRNVVGSLMWPTYAFRSMALLFALAAVVFALGGLAQINPIWVWGAFEPEAVTQPAQPDWYVGWGEGALRIFPAAAEFTVFGYLVPSPFLPAVALPGLTFLALYAWPFLDKLLTGDRAAHHVTARPRDCPIRTAIGGWALTFYGLLLFAGSDDIVAEWLKVPIGNVVATLRIVVPVVPFVVGAVVFVLARALRDSGAQGVLHLGWQDIAAGLRRRRRAGPEVSPAEEGPPAGESTAGEQPPDAPTEPVSGREEVAR
ncbi:MAG: cytochrome b N-terminal domain-containing protein [Actinomycetota bacterium]|nr:cytochrome b N-terminal domain-containing protein [Actinomycetota bacterium]